MFYCLDTEFNGFGGELISLALYREDGQSLYLLYPPPANPDPWVEKNVLPILRADAQANKKGEVYRVTDQKHGAKLIAGFLSYDKGVPYIIADWPDDIVYFSKALITGPGQMAPIKRYICDVARCESWPSEDPNAVRHNAWYDAKTLYEFLFPKKDVQPLKK